MTPAGTLETNHDGGACSVPHLAERKENDLLIGGFVRDHLNSLTEADIEALETLLERPDPDLADWLTGRRPIAPEDATPMLLRMRASLVR